MRATKRSFAMTSAVLRPCLAFRSFHCEAAVPPAPVRSAFHQGQKVCRQFFTIRYNNNAGVATLSATFTDFPNSSSDLADDFVVPGGQTWNVDSIDADGVYFNGAGPATDWNVFIYTDSAGLPGTQIFSATNIPIVEVGTTFTANLTPAAVLGAGTYWIEIQANMTFGTQGEWGWSDRTVQSNEGAAFRNPGGDFGCRYRLGDESQSAFLPQADPTRFTGLTGRQAAEGLLRQRRQARPAGIAAITPSP